MPHHIGVNMYDAMPAIVSWRVIPTQLTTTPLVSSTSLNSLHSPISTNTIVLLSDLIPKDHGSLPSDLTPCPTCLSPVFIIGLCTPPAFAQSRLTQNVTYEVLQVDGHPSSISSTHSSGFINRFSACWSPVRWLAGLPESRLSTRRVLASAFYIDNFHRMALVPVADLFDHSDELDVVFVAEDVVCGRCGSFLDIDTERLRALERMFAAATTSIDPENELIKPVPLLKDALFIDATAQTLLHTLPSARLPSHIRPPRCLNHCRQPFWPRP
ncbi:hypothetical protein CROQUDRAFT_90217 [Cronartium quercuum f. sp. fusiforme G11]|uniref:SET domain-containing protein n=1 Tax=Cronartium quercuum f. sp. fusiforme G11 TaxID=708437 RepID=A0A9P6NQK4_9BASI|nr:hypothetical protein CROQUDRAFT_90217 [Cronartium quercuum f. sp. fusiforme G11]